jgi:tetratricopeptide (TPR) repeat protein
MWNCISKFVLIILVAGFSAGIASIATAQSVDPDTQPKIDKSTKPKIQKADSLDQLFSKLKKERHPKIANRLSKRIWAKWFKSDSDSIDLLTGWARKAMNEKNYAVALDLLDQITTLRPDYAEGWNQRATLHYFMQNYGKSLSDVERVLALEPRHFGALSGMGLIFQAFDQKERALAAWYKVLEVYPAMTSAQKAVIHLEDEIAAKRI